MQEQSYRFTTGGDFTTLFSRCGPPKGPMFFAEQSYRSRWKQKAGVRQMQEQSYRFTTGGDFTKLLSRCKPRETC